MEMKSSKLLGKNVDAGLIDASLARDWGLRVGVEQWSVRVT